MSHRLLIIDDDPRSVDQLQREVKPLHWTVVTAFDQEAAYCILKGQQFDFALVDIRLKSDPGDLSPDPEVGYATILHLREHYVWMKIIAVTAYDDMSEVNTNAVKAGADDFWSKRPDASEKLMAKIRRLMEIETRAAPLRKRRNTAKVSKQKVSRKGGAQKRGVDAESTSASSVAQQGNRGTLVVGVNSGTIIVGGAKVEQEATEGAHDVDDLSGLKSADWRKEITDRVRELKPTEIKDIYEHSRELHHNRLRPAFRDAAHSSTYVELRKSLEDARAVYAELNEYIKDKIKALVLPDFTSDFESIQNHTKSLKEAQEQAEALGNVLLKKVARLVNLLEGFKATPEEMLLAAHECLEGQTAYIIIEWTGLQLENERQDGFYRKGEILDAFRNLITNALESLNGVKKPKLSFASKLSGGLTSIRISDNGRGVPESDRDRIFEDGFSTKGSTGYGLGHAKRVFEAHGGYLRLLDGDLGATFEVLI